MVRFITFIIGITFIVAKLSAGEGLPTCVTPNGFRFGYSNLPSYAMSITTDGTQLVSTDEEGIHIYRTDNLWQVNTLNKGAFGGLAIDWSENGNFLAEHSFRSSDSQNVRLWKVNETTKLPVELLGSGKIPNDIHTIVWSHDNAKLALVGTGPTQIWDTNDLKLLFQMSGKGTSRLTDYNSMDHALAAWSPDDRYFITTHFEFGDSKDVVGIWETSNWTEITHIPTSINSIEAIDWSSTNQIAIAGTDANVEIWNGETFELEMVIEDTILGSRALAWSPSGKQLAIEYSAGEEEALYVWDTTNQSFLTVFVIENSFIRDIAWASEDFVFGRTLDGNIYKWNVVDQCLAGMITYEEP